MPASPRILVIEDNATTARTLNVFLASAGYDVTHASSGHAGLQRLDDTRFDLVLLDIMLPDIDGVSVCKQVRGRSPIPIVMLTARTAEEDIVLGLEAGADDYVCKPFGSRELIARIRRCLARTTATEPGAILKAGNIELDTARREVRVDSSAVRLTKSEFDLLALLMRHRGRVFTRDQMIEMALGPDFDGFDRTIDTHIWSLRKKLGEPRGAPRYLLSELGVGYRFADAG